MLRFYNSLSKKLEYFRPKEKKVMLYTCGPTVYSRPHIGNYRTYVWEDAIKRYLLFKGFKVLHVMNITDYDDTILKEIKRKRVAWKSFVSKYTRLFFKDKQKLNILPADFYPKVSEYVNDMGKIAFLLCKKGFAYQEKDGKIFFDISKIKDYGKLIGKSPSKKMLNRKVLKEEYKFYEAGDFLIWQPCKKDSKYGLNSKFGKIFPPWNIQCAAMSLAVFGKSPDITIGGIDNIFSHHENTRVILNAYGPKSKENSWIHIRHLTYKGKKMSKSKRNVILLPTLYKKGFSPNVIRFMFLSVHYRQKLNFKFSYLSKIKERFQIMQKIIDKILKKAKEEKKENGNFQDVIEKVEKELISVLDDDFNFPLAIQCVENFLFSLDLEKLSSLEAKKIFEFLKRINAVFGFLQL
jgi:cysteinyl-tRNA synthetase